MKVDMKHHLTTIRVHIEHRAVTRFMDPPIPRDLAGCVYHVSHQEILLRREVIQCCDVGLGCDENMDRRLRVDVLEGVDTVVLIHFRRRNLPLDDPAEKTVGHAGYSNLFKTLERAFS